jgi:lipopolysaccharide/colanic/teichoic acid biosynthesis glycosyltransferase
MKRDRTKGFYYRRGKRWFDLCVIIAVFPLLLPLIVILAILVLLELGWPILFNQRRPGLYGLAFTLHKFRSMTNDRDGEGRLKTDEERLTKFGRRLRNSSLDELPELFNVLKGEMSLVGPRPLLMQYLDRYTPEQGRRHQVKPGITGWAQVNGRNAMTWEDKFRMDVWYLENLSLCLDLKILALTIWKILRREGINQPGHATVEYFQGTSGATHQ